MDDNKRKRAVADEVDDVGEGRKFDRKAPDFLLQLRWRRWFCFNQSHAGKNQHGRQQRS